MIKNNCNLLKKKKHQIHTSPTIFAHFKIFKNITDNVYTICYFSH